jgi:chemotaxis family two-component system sensor histidine kinase/response regulator PixL
MVVDDSEIMGKLVKIGLKDSKYHITAFTEAKDALEEVSKGSAIDVILCDINMPDMDGFNFLSKVRASNAIVPVVYSSSDPPLDRLERALRAGADSYLPKPFKRDELYNAIRQALLSSELVKMEMMTF